MRSDLELANQPRFFTDTASLCFADYSKMAIVATQTTKMHRFCLKAWRLSQMEMKDAYGNYIFQSIRITLVCGAPLHAARADPR